MKKWEENIVVSQIDDAINVLYAKFTGSKRTDDAIDLAIRALNEQKMMYPESGLGEISKIMNLSLTHIRKETSELMRNGGLYDNITVYDMKGQGWLVHVPAYDIVGMNIPGDLMTVIRFAYNNGCTWLSLRDDGIETKKLPVYDDWT